MRRRLIGTLTLAALASITLTAAAQQPPDTAAQRQKIRAATEQGVAFLRAQQQDDGSWQRYPASTALAMTALLRSGLVREDEPAIIRAAAFLARHAQPNGAIYTDALGPAQRLPTYNTALSMVALHATGDPAYRQIVERAQQYLVRSQYAEATGVSPDDPRYGGIGYGSQQDRPDLSNLQHALEALRETGHPADSEVFSRAVVFLQRTQNREASNDQDWAGDDGGFVYRSTGDSFADEYTGQPNSSYGSMTYAGLKSYLYANISKDDPRAQAAYDWIRQTFTVTQNPRLRDDGLYYYYHVMAKTLGIYGQRTVTDPQGRARYWATELSDELISRQRENGSWANANRRWREDDGELVTSYALLALAYCNQGL